jgi:hypothetical protein
MDRRLIPPTFPNPPAEYDQRFMLDLVRSLNDLVTQLRAPGLGRNTTTTLTNTVESPTGLEPGTVWNFDGFAMLAGHRAWNHGYVCSKERVRAYSACGDLWFDRRQNQRRQSVVGPAHGVERHYHSCDGVPCQPSVGRFGGQAGDAVDTGACTGR